MKSKKEYLTKNKERKEEKMDNSSKKIRRVSLILLFVIMLLSALAYSLYYLKVDIGLTPTEEKYAYNSSHSGRFGSEIDPLTLKDDIVVSSGAGGHGTLWMPIVHQNLGGNGRTDLLCGTW